MVWSLQLVRDDGTKPTTDEIKVVLYGCEETWKDVEFLVLRTGERREGGTRERGGWIPVRPNQKPYPNIT
ncbi:protein NrnU [Sesbania bispinosa]|nr:protein NrnU [Sesbania bispinosa]